jgi:predicted esterase
MKSPLLALVFATLGVTALSAADAPVAKLDPTPFSYDRNAPLNVSEVGSETRGGAVVRDVTFVGVDVPVKTYIVAPASGGSGHAGILFVHWLGEPKTTNRTEFLDEAVELASHGVVSVLVDCMWTKSKWYETRDSNADFTDAVHQVVELRRALDLLVAQPGVDAQRLALVGHDFGAMYGLVAGAVDRRPRTYVLMAATSRFADWLKFGPAPKDMAAYTAAMGAIDPITLLPQLAPTSVFLQFGNADFFIPNDKAIEFYAAGAPRKVTATYAAKHNMRSPEAAADRRAWLMRELGLK